MLCKILISFPFSRDGVKIEQAIADTNTDIPNHLVEGLTAAHYLAPPDGGSPAAEPAADALIGIVEGGQTSDGTSVISASLSTGRSEMDAELSRRAAVDIPADFESRHHALIMAIAKKITGDAPPNKVDAIEVVKAELARRAA